VHDVLRSTASLLPQPWRHGSHRNAMAPEQHPMGLEVPEAHWRRPKNLRKVHRHNSPGHLAGPPRLPFQTARLQTAERKDKQRTLANQMVRQGYRSRKHTRHGLKKCCRAMNASCADRLPSASSRSANSEISDFDLTGLCRRPVHESRSLDALRGRWK